MGLLLVVLGIIIIAVGYIKFEEEYCNVGIFILFLGAITLMVAGTFYPVNVDNKIALCEQENKEIEAKVKATVQAYKNYENETYDNCYRV